LKFFYTNLSYVKVFFLIYILYYHFSFLLSSYFDRLRKTVISKYVHFFFSNSGSIHREFVSLLKLYRSFPYWTPVNLIFLDILDIYILLIHLNLFFFSWLRYYVLISLFFKSLNSFFFQFCLIILFDKNKKLRLSLNTI